jgi:hypothetical protein
VKTSVGDHIAKAFEGKEYRVGPATFKVYGVCKPKCKKFHDWWIVIESTRIDELIKTNQLGEAAQMLQNLTAKIELYYHVRMGKVFFPVDNRLIKRWADGQRKMVK